MSNNSRELWQGENMNVITSVLWNKTLTRYMCNAPLSEVEFNIRKSAAEVSRIWVPWDVILCHCFQIFQRHIVYLFSRLNLTAH
jgi:hypothetical protein